MALRDGIAVDARHPTTALTATVVVAFVLCLSRWGTTIGIGSFYLSDLLLAAAMINAAFTHRPRGSYPGLLQRPVPPVPAIFWLFLADVVMRFLTSIGNGALVDWVRDAAPYLYGVVALLSASSIIGSSEQRRTRTARFFTVALALHLVWTAVMVFTPLGLRLNLVVPFVTTPLFQVRPDIDAALNAVFAGICLRTLIQGPRRLWAALGLVITSALVLSLATRAGTISLFVVLAVTFGLSYSHVPPRSRRRAWLVLAAGVLILVAGAVLPATTPGQRIIATVLPATAVTDQQLNAEGTAKARSLVWSGVIDWTTATPARGVFGSGFGNDFLAQSGTLAYLEGTTYTGVRSPHDWFIGTFARLGVIGLALAAGSLAIGLITIWRRRRQLAADPLAPIAVGIFVAIIPVASLGVVLEAPFGAIPFFWALGVLFAFRGSRTPLSDGRPSAPSATGRDRSGGARVLDREGTLATRSSTAAPRRIRAGRTLSPAAAPAAVRPGAAHAVERRPRTS